METTDLLIIGGGPGGLGAAQTFARTLRPFILYDSGVYRNGSARISHTIMGFDGADGATWRSVVRDDIAAYSSTQIRDARIVSIKRVAGGDVTDPSRTQFHAVDQHGNAIAARKVILATGVRDVLADIPGLAQHWGSRAIHCLFCHGTESGGGPIGFLLSRANPAVSAAVVNAMLTMWAKVPNTERYILTNGMDPEQIDPLVKYRAVIDARGFQIVSSPIKCIETTPSGDMRFLLQDSELVLPYVMTAPETVEPSEGARSLLTPALLGSVDLGPMGSLPPPPSGTQPAHFPPRAGSDPRTPVRGLFWAGNTGSPQANVSMSAAQGQIAAIVAADEVAMEDLEQS